MNELDQNFTREILRKVRQIEISSNRLVSEALAGSYHSAFKGQGIDFEEVREYQAGDEVRSIDWNVTAQMGSPFVKQYREERELTILLAIDVSESGSFGSVNRSKRERLAELGALLAETPTPLPPAPLVQYADFAVWQRRRLEEGGVLAQQKARRFARPHALHRDVYRLWLRA